MKRLLTIACVLGMASWLQAEYLLPETISLTPDGKALIIGEKGAGKVSIRDFSGKELETYEAGTAPWWTFGLGDHPNLPVTGAAMSPDGSDLFYTADNGNAGRLYNKAGKFVVTGNCPMTPTVSPDGKYVYVCNRFDNNVQKYDAKTLKLLATAPALREANGCALGKDGKLLFVINLLPTDAAEPVGYVAAKVTVVDTETFKVIDNIHLPDGSTGVRAVTASPDGKYIYLTHTQARYQLPTTQLERGWMNTAALSVFNGETGKYVNTVLLDDVDLGAANPWGVSVSPDGKWLLVAHAGSRDVNVIDRVKMHERLDKVAAGIKVTEVSLTAADVHNDLSFLSGIRFRVSVTPDGPRGIVATNDKAYVVCYFADALVEIPFTDRVVKPTTIALNGELIDLSKDPVLRGEMLFNDGTKCFQLWQSCASCHPDGRIDGLNWDLMNDGIGNPKQTKSLFLSRWTPPTMITGIRKDMFHCNRAGFHHIQFYDAVEEDAKCVDAYVMSMKPVVSPYAREENAEAIARGKAIFMDPNKADCASCHMPDHYFTAAIDPEDGSKSKVYDLGLGTGEELGQTFDVPTLNEVWRTAPYLYDGRAASMLAVLKDWNKADQHGITTDLTEQELKDLELYILSL